MNKTNKGQRRGPRVSPLGAGNGEKESVEMLNVENHRRQRKRFKKNALPKV